MFSLETIRLIFYVVIVLTVIVCVLIDKNKLIDFCKNTCSCLGTLFCPNKISSPNVAYPCTFIGLGHIPFTLHFIQVKNVTINR